MKIDGSKDGRFLKSVAEIHFKFAVNEEKSNFGQDPKFLPENQKLDRFINLGGPSNQPLFRIITRSLKPPRSKLKKYFS